MSDRYVAQTTASAIAVGKPRNFLAPARREQIRETLRAAKATGRDALFEFTAGCPAPEVVDFIRRNALRLGVIAVIEAPQGPI